MTAGAGGGGRDDGPAVSHAEQHEITGLLVAWRAGDEHALDRLLPLVYETLHRLARRHMSSRRGHTLGTTGLVHEAYLKLVDTSRAEWRDRAHFFKVASIAMRQILIAQARRFSTARRGGAFRRVTLDEGVASAEDRAAALLELDDALGRLGALDERLVRVVECRYFAGLSEEETAEALEVTTRTVRRDWVKARGVLYELLAPGMEPA